VLDVSIGPDVSNSSELRCMRWYHEVVEIPHTGAKMSVFGFAGCRGVRSLWSGWLHVGDVRVYCPGLPNCDVRRHEGLSFII
jgi:hypothetical protein